jgi:UDP-GlcNAc:undecaprenyl-phosphate/decaprenyl-phosphate GlcNAc-1-phosphate transferase
MIILFFLILNVGIFFLINKINYYYNVYDLPNSSRKIHKNPTPTSGGLIILLNLIFLYAVLFLNNIYNFTSNLIPFNQNIFLYFFLFFLVGYIDDKYNLKALYKFLIISLVSLFLIFFNQEILIKDFVFLNYQINFSSIYTSYIFTLFCFLSIINAFNMYDGINLQLSSLSFFILIILLFINPNMQLFYILLLALILFMFFNFNGSIFLGDSGSILIAVILALSFITFNKVNFIKTESIISLLFLPGIDMIRLFLLRLKNKKNPFHPDGNHIHHLILSKYSSNIVVMILLGFTILSYFLFVFSSYYFLNFICLTFIYLLLIFLFKKAI